MKHTNLLLIVFACGSSVLAHAEVKLPAIFGDHMVLQENMSVPVWGMGFPGESVKVTAGPVTVNTKADMAGKWMVRLDGLPASSAPIDLTVAGFSNRITIHDVLVGDVWLCSGRSNMALRMDQASNAAAELPLANRPNIRFFVVEENRALSPQSDCKGHWEICTPDSVKSFSAVGYLFSKEIADTEKVPVGVIGAYSQTAATAGWASIEALQSDFDMKTTYMKKLAEIQTKPAKINDANAPSVCYNTMIAPLVPFALKGVVLYQGEDDENRGSLYEKLFSALIADWRKRWGEGDFPFVYVQVPNFGPKLPRPSEQGLVKVRQAQLIISQTVPNMGMAVALDLGDVTNLNPPDKADVTHRLALVARHLAYGEPVAFAGPVYDSCTIDDNKIHITFKNVGQGLKVGGSPAFPASAPLVLGNEAKGFAVAGADDKFVWAKATIDNSNTITVSSDSIATPLAVSYGWSNDPDVNIYNSDNFPLGPFRTGSKYMAPPSISNPNATQTNTILTIQDIAYYHDFPAGTSIYLVGNLPTGATPVAHTDTVADPVTGIRTVIRTPLPYLEIKVGVSASIRSNIVFAKAYFYDRNKKLIPIGAEAPAFAIHEDGLEYQWPVIFDASQQQDLYFVVPGQVLKQGDWSAVIVFGDSKGVDAKIWPESGAIADYDFPEKSIVHQGGVSVADLQGAVEPIIEHVEQTGITDDPRLTLFLCPPPETTDISKAKGVLALCCLGYKVEAIKSQLENMVPGDRIGGDLNGAFKFAADHRLLIICWGSHILWDATKNWDDQDADTMRAGDKTFDQAANAWAKGIQYFVDQYKIPSNGYLLSGESGAAQYACRLALRKPDYFLAVHIHIPSSFDKPTPEAKKILWCLTTGELEPGYQRSLRFYAQCRALGYPIIYKALPGVAHSGSKKATDLGMEFFNYALQMRDQRAAYDQNTNDPFALYKVMQNPNGENLPWLASFQKPAYVGDIVNQGIFPYEDQDMVPVGYRVPLPTKEIADAWDK